MKQIKLSDGTAVIEIPTEGVRYILGPLYEFSIEGYGSASGRTKAEQRALELSRDARNKGSSCIGVFINGFGDDCPEWHAVSIVFEGRLYRLVEVGDSTNADT